MKHPKKVNRYCPYCNKKTEHKVDIVKTGHKRGSLKRGGKSRVKKRGDWRGKGNLGRYSSGVTQRKTKTTTKKVLKYTCQKCKKSHQSKKGKRLGRIQLEVKT